MAAQKGSAYLLKIGDGGGPETFTTIAGARNVRFRQGRRTIDVTDADSANLARELLDTGGVKEASVSFSGIFTDAATDSTLQTDFAAGTLRNFQIVVPDFGTYEGGFIISSLEHSGTYDAGGEFSIELESGGDWTFTAA
jgi:TP901-1 family phage major tail protein